jgi:hypothetical protein
MRNVAGMAFWVVLAVSALNAQQPVVGEGWHWCPEKEDSQLPKVGDFAAAYGIVANGHTRIASPASPTSVAGNASASFNITRCTTITASSATFNSTQPPVGLRATGFGVTKFDFNRGLVYQEKYLGNNNYLTRNFSLDYTITIPTNSPPQPGIQTHAHQFLGEYAWDHSLQHSFEIDAGAILTGRTAKPGYQDTALLTLVANRNLKTDGSSPSTLFLELDAGTHSEENPASIITTEGLKYKINSNWSLQAAALTGLTSRDPEIGFALTLKFKANLAGK